MAQMVEPAHFSSRLEFSKDSTAEIVFQAAIDEGWHIYSTDLGDDGPIATSLIINKIEGAELVNTLSPRGKEIEKMDNMFGMKLRFFENEATFVQKIRFTEGNYDIDVELEYGACNDESCLPPTRVPFKKSGVTPASERNSASAESSEADSLRRVALSHSLKTDTASAEVPTFAAADTWAPVVEELAELDNRQQAADMAWWQIFLEGLLGGLIAIFTPCVWPIIPLTISFFLKKSDSNRSRAVRDALTYGIAIVVIYVGLGLLVTLAMGASTLNAMATNVAFNIFFFLLLLVFAASFLGAFEITLPSSWADKIDEKKSRASGMAAIFLMAFMLVVVSFSCTGPIIGVLLVAVSSQGSILAPTIGMLGFAIALAVPFTIFALFPSLIKKAPRSGSWMNAIKVNLGFIELAFALKFLSVADMAYGWRILDRETFLALWIAIFALLGAYNLGFLKFKHDDDERRTNVPQFFIGLISIAFSIYMVPGLFGAPLKAISAFAPPMSTQDFVLMKSEVRAQYNDYDEALRVAQQQNKPLLIDFTGYGCVNCRKMEASVWADATVAQKINTDFVLVSLYVDDKTPLAEPIKVEENGQETTLRTVGDKWSYLQRHKFGANTQPFYVIIDAQGTPLQASRSYDEDVSAYLEWLDIK